MDDLISRQAAKLKVARVVWEDGDSCYDFIDKCVDCLDDVPSAQPERKKGKWIIKPHKMMGEAPCCSECGIFEPMERKFCPNCGSRMEQT